jgi:predicted O-methyltransferase YrrM
MLKKMFHRGSSSEPRVSSEDEIPRPDYGDMKDRVPTISYSPSSADQEWYPPVMIGAAAIGARVVAVQQIQAGRDLLSLLEPDEYCQYLLKFYDEGLRRFGASWGYADIITVLLTLSELLHPRRYLEIGVRRGRSVCAVASRTPDCDFVMFDMWIQDYAGMENPGPGLVETELAKVGYRGSAAFVDGDSHETLPQFFAANPGMTFDMITVDGDHSDEGAAQDLRDVLPHLAIGGAVVFDDICHPQHPGLGRVWKRLVVDDPRFSTWSYDEAGYGVGFGIRRW